jgi:iron complex transport system ATP-binding protein
MNKPALHIRPWTAMAGKKQLFRLSEFQLFPGQFTAIIGRNGVGKSTLLKTIAGIRPAPPSTFFLFGNDLSLMSEKERAKIMATAFSTKQEIPRLQVIDVVAMGRYVHGDMHTKHAEERTEKALQLLHINHLAFAWADELSDGEWQKVTLARAIAQEARLLLLDEPTAYLDYLAKEELMVLLQQLASEQQLAILFTSHDLELVKRLSHHIWSIDGEQGTLLKEK